MGGKKPIGAAPSRGHHHNTAHSGHRVWSTPQFSYWGSASDSLWAGNQPNPSAQPTPIPFSQPDRSVEALEKKIVELSTELETVKDSLSVHPSKPLNGDEGVFTSSFDQSISDRLLYASEVSANETDESREEDSPLNLIASRIGPFSTTGELWRRIDSMETEVRVLRQASRRIHSLETTVLALTERLERMESKTAASTKPSPSKKPDTSKPLSHTSEPFLPATPPSQSTSIEIRKLQDRVRTLEGRQGALQSKISAADSVLGRSGPSWQTTLKAMHDRMTEYEATESKMTKLLSRIEALELKRDSSPVKQGPAES